MAIFADVRCINMPVILPGSVQTVVAGETAARNVGMIKDRRNPLRTVMAVVTIVATDDMSGGLALCRGAVMAGPATARYGHMVHVVNRAPGGRGVTALAGLSRCDVARRFHRRQDGAYL